MESQQGKQRHTHKWSQAIPPEPIRGYGGTELGSAAQLTLCSHPKSLSPSAPRRRHCCSYQCQRKGVGWLGDVRSREFLRWLLGKHRGWAWSSFLLGPVYRSAGPGLAVIMAKCTDSTINKQTADSTGANITPNVYQLSPNL